MTDRYTLHAGDCRDVLRDYDADHFDSIVCDPPYGLSFMGKGWDRGVPGVEFWRAALQVAKPGAHLLAFGGTRTFHRLTCAIEDAGWEVRDVVCWLYGSGFPKSLNVGDGWGTALKPAWEPVIVARKPFAGTVAANLLQHGTGALNIDGCRVGDTAAGRWPANVIHDGSDEVVAGFPDTGSSGDGSPRLAYGIGGTGGAYYGGGKGAMIATYGDAGSAARFFYCAKASRADREEGCDDLPARSGAAAVDRDDDTAGLRSPRAGAGRTADTVRNFHPTVKPTDLMRYLCRLVTPPAGLVLDPFMGSGSTGKGALLEGFRFVGIDLDPAHVAIAEARCQFAVDTVDAEAAAAEAPGAQLALF